MVSNHARPFKQFAWMHDLFQIDLVKGYHQIPVAAEDIPKTKPFALFEYLFAPFCLSNTTHTFQCMMDQGVSKLEAVFAYMDDSGVSSPTGQTHLVHSEALFAGLVANGLALNFATCVFAVPTLEILGHMIWEAGSAPTAGHTAALRTSSICNAFSAW
jgi:hypothetical protein